MRSCCCSYCGGERAEMYVFGCLSWQCLQSERQAGRQLRFYGVGQERKRIRNGGKFIDKQIDRGTDSSRQTGGFVVNSWQ